MASPISTVNNAAIGTEDRGSVWWANARGSEPRSLGARRALAAQDAAEFVDREELTRGDVRQLLDRATGPLDFDGSGDGLGAQAEGESQVALRAVAGAAADAVPLLARLAFDADDGADAVAIRLRAHGADGEPVIAIAAVIAEKVGGAVVGGDEQVEVAVMVDVGVGGAASDDGAAEFGGHGRGGVFEFAFAGVAEEERGLPVLDLGLDASDFL